MPPNTIPWRNTAPGRWERPLDSVERFFYLAAPPSPDRSHLIVTAGAKVSKSCSLDEGDVREAWKNLRHLHPRIASTVLWSNTTREAVLRYEIPSQEDLDEWISQTLIIDHTHRSAQEAIATIKPLPVGVLMVLPQTREIVFQIPHHHSDGVGAIKFLEVVVAALSKAREKLEHGKENVNLQDLEKVEFSKVIPESFEMADLQLRATEDDMATAQKFINLFFKNSSIALVPQSPPGDYSLHMERLTLSEQETAEVCAKTKQHGFTITHVCHSAMVQAVHQSMAVETVRSLRESEIGKGIKRYKSLLFFNLRNQLSSGHDNSPVSLRLTVLPISLELPEESSKEFSELATNLKDLYKVKNRPRQTVLHKAMYGLLANKVSKDKSEANVHLSSIGVVEKHIQSDLNDFWVGCSSATPEITTYVWTFKNCLTFAVWYNGAYYSKNGMAKFLQAMRQNLFAGLGVNKQEI